MSFFRNFVVFFDIFSLYSVFFQIKSEYFTYATEKRRESVCSVSSLYIDLFFYFHAIFVFCGNSDFDVFISSLVLLRNKVVLTFLAKTLLGSLRSNKNITVFQRFLKYNCNFLKIDLFLQKYEQYV